MAALSLIASAALAGYFLWIIAWFRWVRPALAVKLGQRLGVTIFSDSGSDYLWNTDDDVSRWVLLKIGLIDVALGCFVAFGPWALAALATSL